MAEEKEGLPEEETPAEPTSPEEGTPEEKTEKTEETVDWEKRYKDLQVDQTRNRQRIAELEQSQTPPEEPVEDYDEENYVDGATVRKIVDQAVKKAVSTVRMEVADSYFRRTYPELVKHENAISGILRSPRDPDSLKGASSEERIDAAVKEFNELTEEARATAKAEAEEEAKEREEKNRKAQGLGGPSTPPPKGEEEGESDSEYVKNRKARSAKQRGLA